MLRDPMSDGKSSDPPEATPDKSEGASDSGSPPAGSGPSRARLGPESWLDAIKKEHALAFGAVGFIVGAVGLFVGLRSPGQPGHPVAYGPPPSGATAPGLSGGPTSAPSEPKPMVHLKLGAPSVRPHLLSDWGPSVEVEGRQAAPNAGPSPSVRFDVDADERGMMMTLVAQAATEVGPQHVAVLVDEREVGRVHIDIPWTRARLPLAPGVIRPGPHVLTLALAEPKAKDKPRAMLFESVTIEPLPAAAAIVCGDASSKHLLTAGWSWPEHDGTRLAVYSDGKSSTTQLMLLPRGREYWLNLTAKAHPDLPDKKLRVNVSINRTKVGSLEIGKDWDAHHLLIETSKLRPGANTVDFRYPDTVELAPSDPDGRPREVAVMVERMGLRPSSHALNVEVGHPDDRAYLVNGFTQDPPWGAPKRFVFSEGQTSRMAFPLKPSDGPYTMALTAFAFEPLAPVEVTVRINDAEPVGKLKLTKEDKKQELTIPAGVLVAGTNSLVFEYSKTGKPSELIEGSQDVRELAAGISVVHVHPAK